MLQIERGKQVLVLGVCGLYSFCIFALVLKGYAGLCLPFMIKVIVANNSCEEYLPGEMELEPRITWLPFEAIEVSVTKVANLLYHWQRKV